MAYIFCGGADFQGGANEYFSLNKRQKNQLIFLGKRIRECGRRGSCAREPAAETAVTTPHIHKEILLKQCCYLLSRRTPNLFLPTTSPPHPSISPPHQQPQGLRKSTNRTSLPHPRGRVREVPPAPENSEPSLGQSAPSEGPVCWRLPRRWLLVTGVLVRTLMAQALVERRGLGGKGGGWKGIDLPQVAQEGQHYPGKAGHIRQKWTKRPCSTVKIVFLKIGLALLSKGSFHKMATDVLPVLPCSKLLH